MATVSPRSDRQPVKVPFRRMPARAVAGSVPSDQAAHRRPRRSMTSRPSQTRCAAPGAVTEKRSAPGSQIKTHEAASALNFEQLAAEMQDQDAPSPEMTAEICACVGRLATTLKPEYAEALQTIDVDGVAVKDFAARKGLSPNNAGVRVFRARDALRKRVVQSCGTCAEHGCFDCTCTAPHDAITDE